MNVGLPYDIYELVPYVDYFKIILIVLLVLGVISGLVFLIKKIITRFKQVKTEKTKVKKDKKDGFFKNVLKELKRVKWPDKKYMVKYSAATFGTIILSSLYFYLIFVLFTLVKGLR